MNRKQPGGARNWRYWLMRELGIKLRPGRPRKRK